MSRAGGIVVGAIRDALLDTLVCSALLDTLVCGDTLDSNTNILECVLASARNET